MSIPVVAPAKNLSNKTNKFSDSDVYFTSLLIYRKDEKQILSSLKFNIFENRIENTNNKKDEHQHDEDTSSGFGITS